MSKQRSPSYGVYVKFRGTRLTMAKGLRTLSDAVKMAEQLRKKRFHDPEKVIVVSEPGGEIVDLAAAMAEVADAPPSDATPPESARADADDAAPGPPSHEAHRPTPGAARRRPRSSLWSVLVRLRTLNATMSWERCRSDVRFTASRLAAEAAHAEHAAPLHALLASWDAIDRERREVDDAVVDADAVVSALEAQLVDAVEALARRLRDEAGDADARFEAFFPEPRELAQLGLEGALPRTKRFAHLAEETHASDEIWASLATLGDLQKRGAAALDARAHAHAAAGRVAAQMTSWKERASAARRRVRTALEAWATANGKPPSYADAFFRAPPPAADEARAT